MQSVQAEEPVSKKIQQKDSRSILFPEMKSTSAVLTMISPDKGKKYQDISAFQT
jgi:hypothetical protein